MEIIMKVKCSTSPGAGSSPHSTLKIVDHHHQLQQHTYGSTGYESNTPPQHVMPTRTYTPNTHQNSGEYQISSGPPPPPASCNDCSLGYCCNMASCCVTTTPQYQHSMQQPPEQFYNNPGHGSPPIEEPEFVSIDDEKVKQYLMKLGQQQLQKQQQKQHILRTQKEPKITHFFSAPATEATARPVVYEIIELDDEDEREKLKQIKKQAEQNLANKKTTPNLNINFAARHTKSLDISLIPKTSETAGKQQEMNLTTHSSGSVNKTTRSTNHNIIAEIDLIDSSNDSYMNDDDDETLPLVAVSCELECDDEDDDNSTSTRNKNQTYDNFLNTTSHHLPSGNFSKPSRDDVLVGSDDEVKNHDENLLVRWEEYEGQKEQRIFFECFLCGKKVQSSYNLRRHMMIHTGERPFGCDLCERRFREFSDLKKHRRRHSNEPNFMCMVCHKLKPVENDPTRCINCCTQSKNAVLMAAMKPATDADNAAEKNVNMSPIAEATQHIKPFNKIIPSTPPQQITSPPPPHSFPTISSVTSFNISAPTTTQFSPNNSTNSTKTSEETQRFLDNIPAVHRPGYNELGMITRKEFPCPLCNRAFGTRHNLKRHYMIHTGEKPFSCTKCRKPFREFSTLKKHMVTHIRERWYKCMRCPVKFHDFLKYTEHKDTHLNDSDSEEYPTASGSSSNAKYPSMQLDAYMDSNDEDSGPEDWLECCECGQRFNEIDAYNDHLKEHDTNSQIFQCYICKRQFETRSNLDKHILQHNQDEDDIDEDDDDV